MIKLSWEGDLHSWDNNIEAVVSPTTKLEIELHTSQNLEEQVFLQFNQGPNPSAVAMTGSEPFPTFEIPGASLESGPLFLSIRNGSTLTNSFEVRVTVVEDPPIPRDDDETFEVDRDSREILIPAGQRFLAVGGDANSEVITFKVPRYADGVDLSTKSAGVHFLLEGEGSSDVEPLELKKKEDGYIYLSWLVSRKVTWGKEVHFGLVFSDSEESGKPPQYIWQTQPATLPIADSIVTLLNRGLGNYD